MGVAVANTDIRVEKNMIKRCSTQKADGIRPICRIRMFNI